MNYRKCFDLFIRLLTTQSSKLFEKFLSNTKLLTFQKRMTIFILIIIWGNSLSILTKAFAGNLLNTYFNVKSVPIVNTLDDVYNNEELLLKSNSIQFLKDYLEYDSSKIKNLMNRAAQTQMKDDDEFLLANVVKGDTVIMGNTLFINNFLERWNDWRMFLFVSNNKYLPGLVNYNVNKNHNLARLMKYM